MTMGFTDQRDCLKEFQMMRCFQYPACDNSPCREKMQQKLCFILKLVKKSSLTLITSFDLSNFNLRLKLCEPDVELEVNVHRRLDSMEALGLSTSSSSRLHSLANPALASVHDYTDLPHFAPWLLELPHPSAALPSPAPRPYRSLWRTLSIHCPLSALLHAVPHQSPTLPMLHVRDRALSSIMCGHKWGSKEERLDRNARGEVGERREAANVEQQKEEEQPKKNLLNKRVVKIQTGSLPASHTLSPALALPPFFSLSLSVPSFIQYLCCGINMT